MSKNIILVVIHMFVITYWVLKCMSVAALAYILRTNTNVWNFTTMYKRQCKCYINENIAIRTLIIGLSDFLFHHFTIHGLDTDF
jgi:hypothetical protein